MRINEFLKEDLDNPRDTVSVDVPLLIRLLEFAREDAKTDVELHNVAERLIALSAEGRTLTMSDYDSICPSEPQLAEDASGGGTSSGAVATSMGGGAGFGKSIFMRRNPAPKKKSKR